MALRFRKSISIIPGVKLNFGKTGMSVSAGVPGLRKTLHTSGRTTTSIGIPGTGLSYVKTESKKKATSNRHNTQKTQPNYYDEPEIDVQDFEYNNTLEVPQAQDLMPITNTTITDIHKIADEPIDWTEVMVSSNAPDNTYNQELWSYFHSVASDVLSGDIDTYLKVIGDINPLNDLLAYGSEFEFGTDSSLKMEVEFSIKSKSLVVRKTTQIYQDYVCSVAIRIARDIFALLPVQNVVVHAEDNRKTVLSVCFDKKTMNMLKFNFIDPSDTIEKFNYNMNFHINSGFAEVNRIEI